jgi:hypothetical protein
MHTIAFSPEKIYDYNLSSSILEWTVADLCQLNYQLMIFKMETVILKESSWTEERE